MYRNIKIRNFLRNWEMIMKLENGWKNLKFLIELWNN